MHFSKREMQVVYIQQQQEKEETKHESESSSNGLSVFIRPKPGLEVLILPVNMLNIISLLKW